MLACQIHTEKCLVTKIILLSNYLETEFLIRDVERLLSEYDVFV